MVLLDAYELQRVHQDYWQKKRKRNIKHNQEVTAMFEARGGTVRRIWECELKKKNVSLLSKRLAEIICSLIIIQ